jgi:Xaa-Pro aminopeptidase
MQERNLDALWISGAANHNPALVYFTGVANITGADLIKRRGKSPVLFHYSMEREEAARTGLVCRNINHYKPQELLRQAGGNQTRAKALRMARTFRELGVKGRVGVAGNVDLASAFPLLEELRREAPEVTLVADGDDPILVRARATKSPDEIESIRRLGKVCALVMDDVAELLTSHAVRKDTLIHRNGDPLTIGDVKSFIRLRITELGAEMPESLIFAQGRDAGIPHSTGSDRSRIVTGQPIVFDLFPCEAGGGYFYDITRTWCLGAASEELERMYQQVRTVHDETIALSRRGVRCREVQLLACRLFAEWGHKTPVEDPLAETGYVHNLGHGVGLAIHESPSFNHVESNPDVLENGAVFTIEPGLYYPKKKIGIRLEDTLALRPDGTAEILAPVASDLVLPMRKPRAARKTVAAKPKRSGKSG